MTPPSNSNSPRIPGAWDDPPTDGQSLLAHIRQDERVYQSPLQYAFLLQDPTMQELLILLFGLVDALHLQQVGLINKNKQLKADSAEGKLPKAEYRAAFESITKESSDISAAVAREVVETFYTYDKQEKLTNFQLSGMLRVFRCALATLADISLSAQTVLWNEYYGFGKR